MDEEEDTVLYATFICPLPYNWIPGTCIQIDSNFTMQAINDANYQESVMKLDRKIPESLYKNQLEEKIEFHPTKLIIPGANSWGEGMQWKKRRS